MQVAYTGWTWIKSGDRDLAVRQLEDSFRDCKYIGYDHVENFAFISDYFEDPSELKAIVDKYDLDLCNLYGHFMFDAEAEIAKAKKQIDFLAGVGGRWFNCQNGGFGDDGPRERPTDPEKLDVMCYIANTLGEYAIGKGVKLCFHPHYGTCVFNESDIDYFAEHTNPEYVYFCVDTAHTTVAGMDPEALIRKLGKRIAYMHLKDVDTYALRTAEGPQKMAAFRTLGHGTVNFPAVKAALEEVGYDGILCVELDNPKISNYHAAEVSRTFLRDVLDL